MIAHWDEVEPYRLDHDHIHGEWTDLGRAAGTVGVGVRRLRLGPGEIPTRSTCIRSKRRSSSCWTDQACRARTGGPATSGGCRPQPPHWHSAGEEIFVVIEGGGTLELWPSPQREEHGRIDHEIREGHIIWRPPSTGIAHFLRAGSDGMRFLAYGTRETTSVTTPARYPRSNKLYFRGLGLVGRLEPLSYDDGEPQD